MKPTARIAEEMRRHIERGEWAEGVQVPSELELMRSFDISRAQARETLVELEMEGYVLRYQGRGSFVAPSDHRIKRLGIKGFRLAAMSCNRLGSHYKRMVIEAFAHVLHDHGIQALSYFLAPEGDSEQRFLQSVRTSGVEGLALWLRDRGEVTRRVLGMFREMRYPFVLCDRSFPDCDADSVVSDNEAIGYELTRDLIGAGHRRIAFLGAWEMLTPTEDRLRGYQRALEEAGLPFEARLADTAETLPDPVGAVVCRVMAHRERPTAFFCRDDRVLLEALKCLETLGYELPGERGFAAVDDDRNIQNLKCPVFSMSQDGPEIGRQTAELLLARIADPERPSEQRIVKALRHEPASMPPAHVQA